MVRPLYHSPDSKCCYHNISRLRRAVGTAGALEIGAAGKAEATDETGRQEAEAPRSGRPGPGESDDRRRKPRAAGGPVRRS